MFLGEMNHTAFSPISIVVFCDIVVMTVINVVKGKDSNRNHLSRFNIIILQTDIPTQVGTYWLSIGIFTSDLGSF